MEKSEPLYSEFGHGSRKDCLRSDFTFKYLTMSAAVLQRLAKGIWRSEIQQKLQNRSLRGVIRSSSDKLHIQALMLKGETL